MQDSKRNTYVNNRLLDSVGDGEGVIISENSTETCILPYVKQMPVHFRCMKQGTQSQVLWDNPEGWGGEEGGSWEGVQDGEHMYTHG